MFADEVVGFHAQQACEKALKAWLSLRHTRYPRAHDLTELLDLLQQGGEDVARFRGVERLTPFAVELRYVLPLEKSDPAQRRTMVADAAERVAHVRELTEVTSA